MDMSTDTTWTVIHMDDQEQCAQRIIPLGYTALNEGADLASWAQAMVWAGCSPRLDVARPGQVQVSVTRSLRLDRLQTRQSGYLLAALMPGLKLSACWMAKAVTGRACWLLVCCCWGSLV